MSLRTNLTMRCTVHARTVGAADEHGNPVEGHADTGVDVLGFVDVAAMSNDAQADGMRHLTTSTALGVFDGCAGIAEGDLIVDANGRRWIVDGRPVKHWSPRLGRSHHVECRLTIAE